MSAATKIGGKLNDICYAQLTAISGVMAYQGRLRMLDTTDFEESVRGLTEQTQCYAITWLTQELRRPVQSGTGTVELTILLFFKLNKDTSSDVNSMYDMVDRIGEALTPDTVWGSLGAKMNRITINRVENALQDSIAEWRVLVNLDAPFC